MMAQQYLCDWWVLCLYFHPLLHRIWYRWFYLKSICLKILYRKSIHFLKGSTQFFNSSSWHLITFKQFFSTSIWNSITESIDYTKNSNQLSAVKSLNVRACVNVVHNGDWSTAVWNNLKRALSQRLVSPCPLPFSIGRFRAFNDMLVNVWLLYNLRRRFLFLSLSKLFDRDEEPFTKRLRRVDALVWLPGFNSIDRAVGSIIETSGSGSFFIESGESWTSGLVILMVMFVDKDDDAVALIIC